MQERVDAAYSIGWANLPKWVACMLNPGPIWTSANHSQSWNIQPTNIALVVQRHTHKGDAEKINVRIDHALGGELSASERMDAT